MSTHVRSSIYFAGERNEKVQRFKRWFWSVVEKMNNHERQDLVRLWTNIFPYCTCPAGRVTYNFHSSCKHLHLYFKRVCNKEHKGGISNMTSSSNSSQSTRHVGMNYSAFLDFISNYEWMSGIFVSCKGPFYVDFLL